MSNKVPTEIKLHEHASILIYLNTAAVSEPKHWKYSFKRTSVLVQLLSRKSQIMQEKFQQKKPVDMLRGEKSSSK